MPRTDEATRLVELAERQQDAAKRRRQQVLAAIDDGQITRSERAMLIRLFDADAKEHAAVVAHLTVLQGGLALVRGFARTLAPTPKMLRLVREQRADYLRLVGDATGDEAPAAMPANVTPLPATDEPRPAA